MLTEIQEFEELPATLSISLFLLYDLLFSLINAIKVRGELDRHFLTQKLEF